MKRIIHGLTCLAVIFLLLVFGSCRFLRVDRFSPSSSEEAGEEGGGETTDEGARESGLRITTSSSGFSAWGGIMRSENYVHLSDPSGLVSTNLALSGATYRGALGVAPEEVLTPP